MKFLYLIVLFPSLLFSINYNVEILGIENSRTLERIRNASSFLEETKQAPENLEILKGRAEEEIETILHVLQNQGYFGAKVTLEIDSSDELVKAIYHIDLNNPYCLKEVSVVPAEFSYDAGTLGLCVGKAAIPKEILDAEETLLKKVIDQGYPFAFIKERKIIADQKLEEVSVLWEIDPGQKCTFGEIEFRGLKKVLPAYMKKKMAFCQGELWSPDKVAQTLKNLDDSALFSTVQITPKEQADDGSLPMVIEVTEGKRRSIALGLSYSTQLGAGFTAKWENRNLLGMGEKLSFEADILQEMQEGTVTFFKPDFYRPGQNLILIGELEYETTKGFTERYLSFSSLLEREINENLTFTWGGACKQLKTTRSSDNGDFTLFKLPLSWEWKNVDDPLDPRHGVTLNFKTTPTTQVRSPAFFYATNQLVASKYFALSDRWTLAARGTLGSILGANENSIPSSERFFAGSENTLRGYNYLTVSPLSKEGKPIGGRSMLIGNLEARCKVTNTIGFAAFYDVGNVYSAPTPQLDSKMLQSVGLGLRYYTPVGPLRFDVAVPLNRRRHIDAPLQFYISVGQSF